MEAMLSHLDEQEYADRQKDQIDEILAWLQAIPSRGAATLPNGFPKAKAPFISNGPSGGRFWQSTPFAIRPGKPGGSRLTRTLCP
jgi:hypothetical protein